jgi:2-isopropylmalate synthase
MELLSEHEIIFDWNALERVGPLSREPYQLYDETLRDGIQSPTIIDPPIEQKVEILHLMDAVGIHWADIGLPGAGPRAYADVLRLAEEIDRAKLRIRPSCAARTHPNDIRPVIEISQRVGRPIEVMAFIGSSPIRQYAEDWDLDQLLRMSAEAIDLGVQHGLPVTYVTEDTTRARPDTLDRLYRNAIDHGATRLCLCDTVGHATPDGLKNLINFVRDMIRGIGVDVGIDWHGHNDRGLAVTNSLHAIEFGATRVHGTALGVGERVGNAAMDQILLNLKLLGEIDWDLSRLLDYCQAVSNAYETPIPFNYPLAGRDAFRTATGVHAAAIIKAEKKGHAWLADRIYSGVPAGVFGRHQEIEIGHMSGESNVIYWLRQHGHEPTEGLVARIFKAAKAANHTLTTEEVEALIALHRDEQPAAD